MRGAEAFFGSAALLFLAAVVFVVVARARGLDAAFLFVTHLPSARDYPGVQSWEEAPSIVPPRRSRGSRATGSGRSDRV
ncbi:hypothetical protein BE15_23650 [Sorangium cellulosum]|uniref:Uncharacterized protein n=1 Tax=Sorangium cellulosum TaxID=56 RepID=A0A150QP74_SORCE|nr:hypothetical protein BE15_23650 [Sorangium cellulosum]